MKKVTFALFFCFGVFTCMYGQTKKDTIKELFQLMKDDSTSTKLMDSLLPVLTQKGNQEMDSTAKAKVQEKIQAIMIPVKKIIQRVQEDRLNLYDKYFTQEEIDDMIAYYKSPAGRKFVHMKPEITKEIVMKVITEYLPEMKKDMKGE